MPRRKNTLNHPQEEYKTSGEAETGKKILLISALRQPELRFVFCLTAVSRLGKNTEHVKKPRTEI